MTEPDDDGDPVAGIGLAVVLGTIAWVIVIGIGGRVLGWW